MSLNIEYKKEEDHCCKDSSIEPLEDDWDAYLDINGDFLKDKCIITNDPTKYEIIVQFLNAIYT